MENKFYYIEYKNNGISGDAFVYTEAVDGLGEDAIVAVDNKSVEELKAIHKYELDASSFLANQYMEGLQNKLDIALVALKSVARNNVNWSHAIVEKALKEIEESK